MASIFNKKMHKHIIKRIILAIIIICFICVHLTLSPQWCLSRHDCWKAEEIDMTLYVDSDYKPKNYQCFSLFDTKQLSEHVKGVLAINGEESDFYFYTNNRKIFRFIMLGSEENKEDFEGTEGQWFLICDFKTVINPNKLCIKITDNSGTVIPEDITQITFYPVDHA